MAHSKTTAIGAAIVLCAAIAGCGAGGRPHLDAAAKASLRSRLDAVGTAAKSHDRARALSALASFASQVESDAAAGELTATERNALETGIARTRARILATVPTPATATGSATGTTS
ncbi:MAG: hypothetical protein ACRDMJ_08500, partial [Solirubrobacteraceae bacterium]